MKWEKLGRIFKAVGQRPWMQSHALVPTPEHIRDDLYRIYFSPRDERGRSNVSYIVIDLKEPLRTLDICQAPCLEPGAIGAFDDSGAIVSWIVKHNGLRRLYYVGWNRGTVVPWRNAIGLAVCGEADDPPSFERHAAGPIMDRSPADPFFVSGPVVLVEDGRWRMWYISGLGWQAASPQPLPRYHIRYTESSDGIAWVKPRAVAIPHMHEGEAAIARPCVLKDGGMYRMWYTYRGDDWGYRIGYAESADGRAWTRLDHLAGLPASPSDWDSEVQEYPTVFRHNGLYYMLYCSGPYSSEGFGLAVASA